VRDTDGTWEISIDGARAPSPREIGAFERGELRVTSIPPRDSYVRAVAQARERIDEGELRKVVLARMLVAQSDHTFDRRALLARLRANDPTSFTFAAAGFIGATPERLIARDGAHVRATPLAGTTARSPDEGLDARLREELLSSDKDLREHALVVDAVRAALADVCEDLHVPVVPEAISTATVWHLATDITGTLKSGEDALTLAARLHPTPAVCGTPRDAALRAIGELEGMDRTIYAGIVGWMDARGDGEWAVALRCAEMQGRIATLFAGAGIVAGSDPHAELSETDAKFRAMLAALGYA
jgi:isochorismate synthase